MSGDSRVADDEHRLLADILHLISQPMTALQCSLEFALNSLDDPVKCRPWIEAALENSERLRCRVSLAREAAQAAKPDDLSASVHLRLVLEEVLSELDPLFHEAALILQCDEVQVSGERSRLLRAFFYVLQNLKPIEASASGTPKILVERKAELVEICFSGFVLQENLSRDQVTSQLQIAKETFESAGGGLMFFCFARNDALVRVFLREPQTQLDLYAESARKKSATNNIDRTALFPQVS